MSSRHELAVDLYRQGLTIVQVAERMGVSPTLVGRLLAQAGETRRRACPRPKSTFAERDKQIVQLYRQNLSLLEVSMRFGISRQRVHQILIRAGEPRREKGGRRRLAWSPDIEAQALVLHGQGWGVERICEELGCSLVRIRRSFRARGLMRKGAKSKTPKPLRQAAVAEYLASSRNNSVVLAKKYNTSSQTIRKWVRAAGHAVRSRADAFGYTAEIREDAVRRFVELGEPILEIAAALGVSRQSIVRWALRKTVTTQTRSQPSSSLREPSPSS